MRGFHHGYLGLALIVALCRCASALDRQDLAAPKPQRSPDRPSPEVWITAELVVSLKGKGIKHEETVGFFSPARVPFGQEAVIPAEKYSRMEPSPGLTLTKDSLTLRATPTIDPDGTVRLDARWEMDMTLRVKRRREPIRIFQRSRGTLEAHDGERGSLTESTLEVGTEKSRVIQADIRLFLTPKIIPGSVQAAERSPKTLTLLCGDFVNPDKNGTGGAGLARRATGAFVRELSNPRVKFEFAPRYRILSQDAADAYAAQLGLHPPFDLKLWNRIVVGLGADSFATGEVAFVRIETDKTGAVRGVVVGMYVRVRDVSSGELINGAAQIATALPQPGESIDVEKLMGQAAEKAAVQAALQILSYTPPDGMILTAPDASAIVAIDRGAQDGMKVGQEMLILRDGNVIGRLRALGDVFRSYSLCRVLRSSDVVRPGDLFRAAFPMPVIAHEYDIATRK